MRVDDEAMMLSHLVVQRTASQIGGLRLPVNARTTDFSRGVIYRLYQAAPYAHAPKLFDGEKVLQVADVVQTSGTAVEQIVGQSDDASRCFCD